jgi:protein-S-isoprenylcysteine O-methyltransferase Ste14
MVRRVAADSRDGSDMKLFQVMREKRALERIFGQTYAEYRARTRRWLRGAK